VLDAVETVGRYDREVLKSTSISNLRYLCRLLSLAIATIFGSLFFVSVCFFAYLLFWRFDIFEQLTTRDLVEIASLGLMFLISVVAYWRIARRARYQGRQGTL
jgi:hypothetical protein